MSTAFRISDIAPKRSMEFRKRVLHVGAAIGLHPIDHDEVYYVLDGEGEVTSDGKSQQIGPGVAAYLYSGAVVGIKQLGDTALPPHLATALRAGDAVGEMNFHRYPVSKWRRYDKLGRFPDGIFPFGDAVVSLNPTYGQGVTMSTVQAANLREVLAEGTHDLIPRLARRTARTTYPVWTMNSVADQVKHGAEGDKAFWFNPLFGLFDQFLGAAETDPVLAEWFLRRTSMLDSLWLTPPLWVPRKFIGVPFSMN